MLAVHSVRHMTQMAVCKPDSMVPVLLLLLLQVWASKWADRAWLSRRARGVAEKELYMSVLLQQVCVLYSMPRIVPAACLPTQPLLVLTAHCLPMHGIAAWVAASFADITQGALYD